MRKFNPLLTLALVTLSLFSVIYLFHPGLPLTHDGQDHVARIANFYQNLAEGNLIPRWAGNLNWGYGHPILEFLYPLPSYLASFFHLLGFSLVASAKVVFVLGMVLSLFFMYLWLAEFLSLVPALFGSALYVYAPYRFVETYVRGDIGENLAFVFIPLILLFIHKLHKKTDYKFSVSGGIFLALLILAHNAISLMFLPFILAYGVLLYYSSKDRKFYLKSLIFLILLGFGLAAFFWIPGILEGKYTLRDIVTKGGYLGRFVSVKQLFYGQWNYGGTGQFTVQLGIFQWIGLILSPVAGFLFFRKKDKNYFLVMISVLYTLAAVFLMLPVSSLLWAKIMLLQNFQFPWRFLAITVFSTAVLGALLLQVFPKKIQLYLAVIFIAIILFIGKDYIKPKDYLYRPESFYTGIYSGTTDTGESSPVWSVRFMEHRPKAHLEVLDGAAFVTEIKRTSIYHAYTVKVSRRTLFAENTLFFPGWRILANGQPLNIQFQDQHYHGIMTFFLDQGSYRIEAIYGETKLRRFADAISFISLIFLLGFAGFRIVKK